MTALADFSLTGNTRLIARCNNAIVCDPAVGLRNYDTPSGYLHQNNTGSAATGTALDADRKTCNHALNWGNVLSSLDAGHGMWLQIEGGAVDWAAAHFDGRYVDNTDVFAVTIQFGTASAP
jgi:alkaline phosphatase